MMTQRRLKIGWIIASLLACAPLYAAVIMNLSPDDPEDVSSIISKNISNLMPEEATNDPVGFLPETFKLDIGQKQGTQMNPLVRKFYSRLSRKDIKGALLALEDLQETQFLNPKLYTTEAQLLVFLKDFDAARAAARKAIRYDQSYMRAHKMLAFINMLDGEYDVAIKDLLASLELKEDDTEVLKLAAFGYLNKNDMEGAARILAHITRLEPESSEAHADLGNAWLRKGDLDYAIMALRRAVELAPDSPVHYNEIGTAFVAKGMLHDALNAYAMSLKADPYYSPALSNMGVLVYNDGQVDAGLRLLVSACDVDINSNTAWNNLVAILGRMFPLQISHTVNRTEAGAYVLNPDQQLYQWGVLHARNGEHHAATSHIVSALVMTPNNPEFMNDLGTLFAGTGGIKLARVLFRRALALAPDYAAAGNNLATVETQLAALEGDSAPQAPKTVHKQITLPQRSTPLLGKDAPQ